MSLIPLVAHLIRQAARDPEAAHDFHDAALASDKTRELAFADIEDRELAELNTSEWQWYASWRYEHGGDLNPTLIEHLTQAAMGRYSRFKLRRLILRDRPTNEFAESAGAGVHAGELPYGTQWLTAQVASAQRDQATELMEDALQCATEASWFLLNRLTSRSEYSAFITEELTEFADNRSVNQALRQRWGLQAR
ncbi:hypothetical protein FHT44_006312 [Mycolicibacterium sp. BK634]|uniref:hypothetical protein n=1 Tax=Mycolicibacterium sp. BK634 TaxID=2587099 RepID=UPI0016199ADD|nr:hypothetical protein [Mycolicibacterium sp. BK634]MBB3753790.1 hypothetical protein [Mycolicibacterium sp. BK634]